MPKKQNVVVKYRDARNGHYVTEAFAKRRPYITVKEADRKRSK